MKKKLTKRKKKSHWIRNTMLIIYIVGIAWSTLAYAFEHRLPASPVPLAEVAPKAAPAQIKPASVRTYVQGAAKAAGVNPHVAEWIVAHESSHRPGVTGDGGESRGLWQINKEWHPEVPDSCAYDVRCSTDWSLQRIREGHSDEWSTWKYCKTKFEDCPF